MSQSFEFFVPGKPATKGSFKAFVHKKGEKAGRAFVVNSDKGCKDWQNRVALAAKMAGVNHYWDFGVAVEATFHLIRPKGHFGTGRNADKLKPSAPIHHLKKPDIDKLVRALLDGLTHVAYRDDSQIISCHIRKQYGQEVGVSVRVTFYDEGEDLC